MPVAGTLPRISSLLRNAVRMVRSTFTSSPSAVDASMRSWLVEMSEMLAKTITFELGDLSATVDPLQFPGWAFDENEPLQMVLDIPPALHPVCGDLGTHLQKLLNDCKHISWEMYLQEEPDMVILIKIFFHGNVGGGISNALAEPVGVEDGAETLARSRNSGEESMDEEAVEAPGSPPVEEEYDRDQEPSIDGSGDEEQRNQHSEETGLLAGATNMGSTPETATTPDIDELAYSVWSTSDPGNSEDEYITEDEGSTGEEDSTGPLGMTGEEHTLEDLMFAMNLQDVSPQRSPERRGNSLPQNPNYRGAATASPSIHQQDILSESGIPAFRFPVLAQIQQLQQLQPQSQPAADMPAPRTPATPSRKLQWRHDQPRPAADTAVPTSCLQRTPPAAAKPRRAQPMPALPIPALPVKPTTRPKPLLTVPGYGRLGRSVYTGTIDPEKLGPGTIRFFDARTWQMVTVHEK